MLSQNLNPSQLEAVNHPQGPLLIAAGAGSGKTRTLTSRLVHFLENGTPPGNIIAITFTNKAAKEMADRVNAALLTKPAGNKSAAGLPFIGTFHSLGARILKSEGFRLDRNANFTIYDDDDSMRTLKTVLKRMNVKKDKIGPSLFSHHIGKIKNELLDPEEVKTGKKEMDLLLPEVFGAYEAELAASNAFDFDDLIEKPVRIFIKYPEVLESYRKKFRCILVDEYQDINTAQYKFIRLLALKHRNISVVGDDQQSIYGFRGSDFRNFLNFEKDWEDAKVVLLEENYRSTGNIVRAASAVIKENKIQKAKTLFTENEPGDPVYIVEHEDERGEAEWIADSLGQILRERRGESKAGLSAVLYRTNAQSRPIEQALIERTIPYQIYGGLRFYDRKEVKDVVAGLRFAWNPSDSASRERLMQNLPKKVFLSLEQGLSGEKLPPHELIAYFIKETGYFDYLKRAYPNAEERIENLGELMAFAGEYKDVGEFLERVSLFQSGDSVKRAPKGSAAINLMTIHIAKGLEFDYVFVAGATEGLLPHQMSYRKAGGNDSIEEERRLMYVAMTRAKKRLHLGFYGLGSRFLYEIPPELISFKSLAGSKTDFEDDEERYITLD